MPLKPSTMPSKQAAEVLHCFYDTDAHELLVGTFSVLPPSQHKMKASNRQNQHSVPDLKTCSSSSAPTGSTAEVLGSPLLFLKTSGHAQI